MNLVCRTLLPLLLGFSSLLCAAVVLAAQAPPSPKLDYPKAKTVDQVDDYHGTKVADPYRWLEDTDSPATLAWAQAENKLTFSYLDQSRTVRPFTNASRNSGTSSATVCPRCRADATSTSTITACRTKMSCSWPIR